MIRTFGFLLILLSTSLAGFVFGESFKKRGMQLKEMERALIQLQNEILYTHTALPEAFYKIGDKSKDPMKNIFEDIAKSLDFSQVESVYFAFNNALNKNKEDLNLEKEDISILLDLAKSLGESDIEGHKKIFAMTLNNIRENISIAEEKMKKNTKMYRYLGVCAGAMIIILLI